MVVGNVMSSSETPWMADPDVLLPTHDKYERQVQSLQKTLDETRVELLQLRSKFSQKTEENSKLQAEINNVSLELLELKGVPVDGDKSVSKQGTLSLSNAHITAGLEQQIRLLTEEKDNALDLATSANIELDTLQKKYKEKVAEIEIERTTLKSQYEQGASVANNYMSLRSRNAELEQLNRKLQEDVDELTSKLTSFSTYFKQSQEEQKTSSTQLIQLRNAQQQLEQILQKKTHEAEKASMGEKSMEGQMEELHKAIENLDVKYREASTVALKHSNEKRQLMTEIEQLKKDKEALEIREADAVKEVRQATQLVENAILEKDQALAREGQKNEEISKLRDELSKVYEEAGEKTRKEVEEVRGLCNKSVDRLMDDIHALEMKVAEKQCEVERVFREKKVVENELDKALKDQMTGGHESEQLQDRCIAAERKADDLQVKLKNTEQQMLSVQNRLQAQISNLENQLRDAKSRNSKLTSDMQINSEKCLQLQDQAERAKKQALDSEHARQLAARKAAKSVASVEQDLELKVTEYEARIDSMEECHQHAIGELQRMLIQQQQLGAKWREQSNSLQQKCESALFEMKEELSVHKKRVEELNSLLAESKRKRAEFEKQFYKVQNEKSKTHEQMLEAQRQLSMAQDQLAKVSKRERSLTTENIKLSSEIDNLKLNTALGRSIISEGIKE